MLANTLITVVSHFLVACTLVAGLGSFPLMQSFSPTLLSPPTITPIDNQTYLEDSGTHTVDLTGIGMGEGDTGETITITAESDNPGLIPNPVVTYTSPDATGSLAITPLANANGTATITVTVDDGVDTPTIDEFDVTIKAVNDQPTLSIISNQTYPEDSGAQTVNLTGIGMGAGDTGQTIAITAESDTPSVVPNPVVTYTSPATTGSLSVTPAANAYGSATITVTVTDNGGIADGGVDTLTRTFDVTIDPVNDPPSFTKSADPLEAFEDAGPTTFPEWATNISAGPANEAGQILNFEVSPATDPLFSVPPAIDPATGNLTFTPAANANGTSNFTITLRDDGGTDNGGVDFSSTTLAITIRAINDPPTLNAILDQTYLEDSGTHTVNLTGIGMGEGDTDQTIAITAVSSNPAVVPNPAVTYTSPNATGSLSITPAANANGTATITVTVTDNGGTADGGVDTLTLTFNVDITAVNDAPSFDPGDDPVVKENSGAVIIHDWATNISAGPANEAGQELTFLVSPSTSSLFSVAPTIDPDTGDLSFTPKPQATGSRTFTITLSDNGGTVDGGIDEYQTQMTITITPFNSPPTLGATPDQTYLEDCGTQVIDLTGISAGLGETDQIITITAESSNPALIPAPVVSYTSPEETGSLALTPVANGNGTSTITVTVKDNGGTLDGGIDTLVHTFVVTVTPVNDPPSFTKMYDPVPASSKIGLVTIPAWAEDILAGPPDEAGQTLRFLVIPTTDPLFLTTPTIDPATGNLSFQPVYRSEGSRTFTIILSDDGGTDNGGVNQYQTTFTIDISPDNAPPTVNSFTNDGKWNRPLYFTEADFTSHYQDADQDTLKEVQITSLPAVGKLQLAGINVTLNQRIDRTNLGKLAYVPVAGWIGATSFGWTATDGWDFAALNASVTINISKNLLFLPFMLKTPTQQGAWQTIASENFEGAFPGAWKVWDDNALNLGEGYFWGKRSCQAASGGYSGWAVGAGTKGAALQCKTAYPTDINSWMVYGPFSLADAYNADLSYQFWADTEYNHDSFCWMASLDGTNFFGNCGSGNSFGWSAGSLDLTRVYTLGNLTGKSSVWIAFNFQSDKNVDAFHEGVYIDDVVLRKCTNLAGCVNTSAAQASSLPAGFEVENTRKTR